MGYLMVEVVCHTAHGGSLPPEAGWRHLECYGGVLVQGVSNATLEAFGHVHW
jgi:hypothetical protein